MIYLIPYLRSFGYEKMVKKVLNCRNVSLLSFSNMNRQTLDLIKILFLSVLYLDSLVDGKFLTVFEKPADGIVKGYAYRTTAYDKSDQKGINETLCAVFYNASYSLVG